MSDGDFELDGLSMFDLFRAEAETHARTLSEGLVALERRPDDRAGIEPLMRAAHSIKGAARIIGLDAAVRLAHAMEDVLVAAQRGTESVGSERIDQLLAGTDLLAGLASVSESDLNAWGDEHHQAIDEIVRLLAAAMPSAAEQSQLPQQSQATPEAPMEVAAEVAVEAADESAGQSAAQPSPVPTQRASTVEAKTVRLAADSVDRMMRLAGEMTIQARRLESTRDPMLAMKEHLLDLDETLEQLEEEVGARTRLTAARERARAAVARAQRQIAGSEEIARRLEEIATSLYHVALGSRMRPFGEAALGFPRLVRDLARELGKQVRFDIVGTGTPVDREILARLEAPLTHMLRNAIDHGIERAEERVAAGKDALARVWIEARHQAGHLLVRVCDDGRGIDVESLRRSIVRKGLSAVDVAARLAPNELLEFLFLPGFSTASQVTEISGRGVGLDVVQAFAREVGGVASIDSELGRGTEFRIELPVSLSVLRAAVVEIGGEPYALPLARLERVVRVPLAEIGAVEGRRQFMLDGRAVGLVEAATVLELGPVERGADGSISVIVVSHGRGADESWYGLVVDSFRGESDLVVRALDRRLGKVPHIAAASVSETGEPLLIVDVDDLVHSVRQFLAEGKLRGSVAGIGVDIARRRRILVVDDSLTVREVERQLLARLGYEVDVAVDGVDGWNAVRAGHYDLLVTDVDMPRMSGLELVAAVRREPRLADLPVIVVSYKDREEDRIAGMHAGANAYLTKGAFRDDSFARAVRELIGSAETS
jgi:two-component system, chemotaxis family, sensor histidine kinase and response regulator WspE